MNRQRILKQGQLINQMVKAGSEVVCYVPYKQTPLERWLFDVGATDQQLPFRVIVQPEGILKLLRSGMTFHTELEITKVMLGVRNLGPYAS
jgi:hypothetical protein